MRGPATQGFDALDNLVSRSRRSSDSSVASQPNPPPATQTLSPPTAAAPLSSSSVASCSSDAMGDDLKAAIEALTKNMELMQKYAEVHRGQREGDPRSLHHRLLGIWRAPGHRRAPPGLSTEALASRVSALRRQE